MGGEDAGRGAGSPRRVHRRRVSQARASSARPACFGRRSLHLRSRAARAGRSPYERRGSRFEARQTEGGYGASSWASRDHFRAYRAQSGSSLHRSERDNGPRDGTVRQRDCKHNPIREVSHCERSGWRRVSIRSRSHLELAHGLRQIIDCACFR